MTALLGYLLYLKYKIKAIRHYALFILTTTFTVAFTTVYNYLAYDMNSGRYSFWQILAFLLFEVFLLFINYSFSLFALGIINKPFKVIQKIFVGIPGFFMLLSVITFGYYNISKDQIIVPPILNLYFMIIIFSLFLTFILYSLQIAVNLKRIENPDLKRALKILALIILIFIPVQALIINLNRQWQIIMLARNLFYFLVNITSLVFAAKYFFIQTPSIMDRIEISDGFIKKYRITDREKEIIELLLTGLSIKEISGKLDRSFKTVNNHIYNIYQKTGAGNKLELLNLIKENQI
jgi:DNA-binding CsgD family transcriptional regulator